MLSFIYCSVFRRASNCSFVTRSLLRKFNCRSVKRFYCNLPQMDSLPDDGRIIWVDLEMTGLDINTSKIIEVACAITDSELKIVAECPTIVIHESDDVLNHMNEWCKNQHGKSGLLEASRKSKVSLQEAEIKVLSFVRQHTYPGRSPLAGNSVHVDKKFIDKYMPEFSKHLHYRIIDVSTIKELCRRWYPEVFYVAPTKSNLHRAKEDIIGSIEELKYYRSTIFR